MQHLRAAALSTFDWRGQGPPRSLAIAPLCCEVSIKLLEGAGEALLHRLAARGKGRTLFVAGVDGRSPQGQRRLATILSERQRVEHFERPARRKRGTDRPGL